MTTRLIAVLGVFLLAATPQQGRGKRPPQSRGISKGKKAADFKLKKLAKSEQEKRGKPEYVKLSQFKNKKPVVLVFGSYT